MAGFREVSTRTTVICSTCDPAEKNGFLRAKMVDGILKINCTTKEYFEREREREESEESEESEREKQRKYNKRSKRQT